MRHAIITILVSFFLMTGANVFYTQHEVKVQQHKWCDLLNGIAAVPPQPNPSSQRFHAQIETLRKDFGCVR